MTVPFLKFMSSIAGRAPRLVAVGIALTAGSAIQLGAWAGLAVLLNSKARFEEKLLATRFAGYLSYARTRRFLPIPLRPATRP